MSDEQCGCVKVGGGLSKVRNKTNKIRGILVERANEVRIDRFLCCIDYTKALSG